VVDVDGVRLVIDASFSRRTSPADRDELWQVLDSIRIG
jgi:hypothetical protein